MTNASIPALKALASLQSAASSHEHAVKGDHAPRVSYQKDAVSFSVISSSSKQIVLQDNANQQRISLDTKALLSNSNGPVAVNTTLPQKGDTLILVSANDERLRFRLVSANDSSPLSPQLNKQMGQAWPDLSLNFNNKAPLNVAAAIKLAGSDAKAQALAKVITQSAVRNGQPQLDIPIRAQIKLIQNATQALASLGLKNLGTNAQNLIIPLSLGNQSKSLQALLKLGSQILLKIAPQSKGAAIAAASINAGLGSKNTSALQVDAAGIKALNDANPALNRNIQKISEAALFNSMSSASSGTTKDSNITLSLNKSVFNALPKEMQQTLLSKLSPRALNDARLLVLADKHSPAKAMVQVLAVEKPVAMTVDAKIFSTQLSNTSGLSHSITESLQGKETKADTKTLTSKLDQNKVVQSDALLKTLQSKLSTEQIAQVSGKLQQALNHTLAHTTSSKEAIGNIKTVLEKIAAQGSPETKSSIQTVLQQIKALSGEQSASMSPNFPEVRPTDLAKMETNANRINDLTSTRSSITDKAALMGTATTTNNETDLVGITSDSSNKAAVKGISSEALAKSLQAILSAQAVTHLTSSAASLAAQNQPIQTSGQNSFVEGLVNLLKLSLASNLSSSYMQSPLATQNQSAIPQSLAAFMVALSKTNHKSERAADAKAQSAKVAMDFMQADPKASLISEIGKLLSNHNSQKLRSAEASLQGQDTYYYALPNLLNKNGKDIELKIQRETEQEQGQKSQENSSIWKLDMKLDAGKYGSVLAKTRLTVSNVAQTKSPESSSTTHNIAQSASPQNYFIDLHLYTSNKTLKTRVKRYLPLLVERLSALGISVGSQACDVGKVDESLVKTKLNVMHTYA